MPVVTSRDRPNSLFAAQQEARGEDGRSGVVVALPPSHIPAPLKQRFKGKTRPPTAAIHVQQRWRGAPVLPTGGQWAPCHGLWQEVGMSP